MLAGSHLESQNYAGWLDGPLGVVYALEAARVINPDPNSQGAVEVAAWCDEEGHFGSFLGSRSYVGAVTEADIDAARDRNSGKTMREALREVGLAGRPRVTAERGRHIGYLEAHIEQGETLESGSAQIGIVTSIVGIWQYRITFTGEQNHAGTTRMAVRRDAGLALARFCVEIDDRFPAAGGPRTVWTTGRITLDPGAPSIIPGSAEMLFQIRDDDAGVIARLEALLRSMAAEVTAQGRCSVAVERIRTGAPAMMDASIPAGDREPPAQTLPAADRCACRAAPATTPRFSRPSCRQACCSCPRSAASAITGVRIPLTPTSSPGRRSLSKPAGACWRDDISVRVMQSGQGLSISGWCHPLVTPEKFYEVRCLAKSQPRGQLPS